MAGLIYKPTEGYIAGIGAVVDRDGNVIRAIGRRTRCNDATDHTSHGIDA